MLAATAALAAPATAAPRVVTMTGSDLMKFSVTQISAKPAEELTIELKVVGAMDKASMAHNFVLLALNTDVSGFVNAAAMARASQHLPKQEKWASAILASTGLAGTGETVKVTFKAPTAPGKYTYICSFPGHYNGGMIGVLTVS